MRFMQPLSTRLLAIVVLVVVSAGLGLGFWQGVVESRKLKRQYDEQLRDFGTRYGDRIAKDLKRRNELLRGASLSLLDAVRRGQLQPLPPHPDFSLAQDPDGAYRLYRGESGVFIHRDTEITNQVWRLVHSTSNLLYYSSFGVHSFRCGTKPGGQTPLRDRRRHGCRRSSVQGRIYSVFRKGVCTPGDRNLTPKLEFISPHRISRVWPAQLVVDHRPDHDITQEIFYQYAAPEQNPKRQLRWTPIYYDYYAHSWVISLLVPCYDGDRFLGVMGADLSLDFLFLSLAQLEFDFDGLRAFIFNEKGNLVLSSDKLPGIPEDGSMEYARLDKNSTLSRKLNAYIEAAASGDYALRAYSGNVSLEALASPQVGIAESG